ncbi:MAG: DUF4157 domain-containing protein [Polyangia bacterium]
MLRTNAPPEKKPQGTSASPSPGERSARRSPDAAPGVQLQAAGNLLQRIAIFSGGGGPAGEGAVRDVATAGTSGGGGPLPHLDRIQSAFGSHDVRGVRAHTGEAAHKSASALAAEAYTYGSHTVFSKAPSLRTAAHEAAHTVQQRSGSVHLQGGIGQLGDRWERNADAVADRVVRGENAQDLLDQVAGSGQDSGGAAGAQATPVVQRTPEKALEETKFLLRFFGIKYDNRINWKDVKKKYRSQLQDKGVWEHIMFIYRDQPPRHNLPLDATWADLKKQATDTLPQFKTIVTTLIKDTHATTETYKKLSTVYQTDSLGNRLLDGDDDPIPKYELDENNKPLLDPVTQEPVVKQEDKEVPYSGLGPLKAKKRTLEKAKEDYDNELARVVDILRATLAYDKFEDMFNALQTIWKLQDKLNFRVVRVKQTYEPLSAELYGDIKLNVAVGEAKHVCEIQLNTKELLQHKNEHDHEHYAFARSGKGLKDSYLDDKERFAKLQQGIHNAHARKSTIFQFIQNAPNAQQVISLARAMHTKIVRGYATDSENKLVKMDAKKWIEDQDKWDKYEETIRYRRKSTFNVFQDLQADEI